MKYNHEGAKPNKCPVESKILAPSGIFVLNACSKVHDLNTLFLSGGVMTQYYQFTRLV
jgi:hypothetical protein